MDGVFNMAGKYLKKNKQVITFHTLTALTMLAEAGSEVLENATGADICSILRDGPSEIQVVLENDEDTGYASSFSRRMKPKTVVKLDKV